MVNLESRLQEIKTIIDAGEYFTIHKARQYGKTTILHALADFLVDMNFSARDIAGMLQLYEDDTRRAWMFIKWQNFFMTIHQVIHTLYPDYVNLWMNVLWERRDFQTEAVPGQKRDF